jgi:hypothetical protein
LEIRQIDNIDEIEKPVFADLIYLKATSKKYGFLGGFDSNELCFILPYVIKEKLIFKYLQFQTETIYCKNDLTINNEQIFLNKVVAYVKTLKVDFINQPPTNVVFNTYPVNSIYAPFGSYRISLTQELDQLWNQIHSKHKNVIRNAIKENIEIKNGLNYLEIALNLLDNTQKRSSLGPIDKKNINSIILNLEKDNNVEIFIAFKDDFPQGCAIIPYNNYSAYYLWGGSIDKPLLGSLNYLHWKIIVYFKSKNIAMYDLVGARINPIKNSKQEGIQRFKSRLGGNLHKGFLWKQPIKKWKYKLFYFIFKIKINKKGDIIDQEINNEKENSINI